MHGVGALLDSGSQSNLITESCLRGLGLRKAKFLSSLAGIGGSSNEVWGKTSFKFAAHFDPTIQYDMDALVVDTIASCTPHVEVNVSEIQHLKYLKLADEKFGTPAPLDVIIGAELYPYIMGTHKIPSKAGSYTALETCLGYVVTGKAPVLTTVYNPQILCSFTDTLDVQVERFWKLDNIETKQLLSPDEEECETIFKDTHVRDNETGRYTVDLPFKENPSMLGDSTMIAKRRFFALERKLESDQLLKAEYGKAIQTMIDNKYLRPTQITSGDGDYIPHHAVFKAESTSTPLRVVFDASCKTLTGKSLNDILHIGAKLHTDPCTILITFRLFKVAMIADIRQMYHQIQIKEEHKKYQRIFWRFHIKDDLQTYELTQVTFGVKSSPFLALQVIKQLAEDEQDHYPSACKVVPQDVYVNDLVTSVADVAQAKILTHKLITLFQQGGFDLVKWSSNNQELMQMIPVDLQKPQPVNLDSEPSSKVLGLHRSPEEDAFFFKQEKQNTKCSKRNILSVLARIFDPLGLINPVTYNIKLIIKELWAHKIDWDQQPPNNIKSKWDKLVNQMDLLSTIKVPRHMKAHSIHQQIYLLGFCDASERGYGAVVYLRVYNTNITTNATCCTLVSAKSRVSPLKVITIPRLELCATVLLARLLQYVWDILQSRLTVEKIFAFSDSTITLNWIRSSPHRFNTFVSNLITQIQELVPSSDWFHVSTEENPVDCLSRGLEPQALLSHTLWWHGPSWAIIEPEDWPVTQAEHLQNIPETKTTVLLVTQEEVNIIKTLADRCSSWTKMLHIMVYVLRFCRILKTKEHYMTSDEIQKAETVILKIVQQEHFSNEIRSIKNGMEVGSLLKKLKLFIHNDVLRVGGRLTYSDLDYDNKHPILLPKSDVVDRIIDHYHLKHLHTGATLLLSLLRLKYWILSARGTVHKRIAKCNICFRVRPKSLQPVMAALSAYRVTPSFAFAHTGVDYAGPFEVCMRRGRGIRAHKAYLCLFVCLTTKALHLELASDMSTPTFIAAYKRFISRRGTCLCLYSDQGTNFVGADGILKEVYELTNSDDFKKTLSTELAEAQITWKFNPPSSSHFGGIWEINVKSVKTHLYRTIGKQILTYEELCTILVQIEALLNSRPFTTLSDNPNDLQALTPSHFLVARPLGAIPAEDLSDVNVGRLSRPQLLDQMVQSF